MPKLFANFRTDSPQRWHKKPSHHMAALSRHKLKALALCQMLSTGTASYPSALPATEDFFRHEENSGRAPGSGYANCPCLCSPGRILRSTCQASLWGSMEGGVL